MKYLLHGAEMPPGGPRAVKHTREYCTANWCVGWNEASVEGEEGLGSDACDWEQTVARNVARR